MQLDIPSREDFTKIVEFKNPINLKKMFEQLELVLGKVNLEREMEIDRTVLDYLRTSEDYLKSYQKDKSEQLAKLDDARANYIVAHNEKRTHDEVLSTRLQLVLFYLENLIPLAEYLSEQQGKLNQLTVEQSKFKTLYQATNSSFNPALEQFSKASCEFGNSKRQLHDLETLKKNVNREILNFETEISVLNDKIKNIHATIATLDQQIREDSALNLDISSYVSSKEVLVTELQAHQQKMENLKNNLLLQIKKQQETDKQLVELNKVIITAEQHAELASKNKNKIIDKQTSLKRSICELDKPIENLQNDISQTTQDYQIYAQEILQKITGLYAMVSLRECYADNLLKSLKLANEVAYHYSATLLARAGTGLYFMAAGYLPSLSSSTVDTSKVLEQNQKAVIQPEIVVTSPTIAESPLASSISSSSSELCPPLEAVSSSDDVGISSSPRVVR